MNSQEKPFLYSPALRMKAGELMGLHDLAPDIADCIVPRLIVPPPTERKGELEPQLLDGQRFPDVCKALTAHWPSRRVFLESSYLLTEFGRDRLAAWLPRMFDSARSAGARPIPLVTASDLMETELASYRSAIDTTEAVKFGIIFSFDEIADFERINSVMMLVENLGLQPEDCVVIADFRGAEFSDPDIVAPIITGVLDTLRMSARWRQIVFQGTNYPEENPALPAQSEVVPRNEWLAWKSAVSFDPETALYLTFGDYAADSAKIIFKNGGGVPIRHYRYTMSDAWLVQRGADQGAHSTIMRDVCRQIVQHPEFAGRKFSSGDDYIFRTAHYGGGPGAAKEWRAVNTNHHITRVVTDIGAIRGVYFDKYKVEDFEGQLKMSFVEQ